eukprot:732419-Rhodomonas_salina.2
MEDAWVVVVLVILPVMRTRDLPGIRSVSTAPPGGEPASPRAATTATDRDPAHVTLVVTARDIAQARARQEEEEERGQDAQRKGGGGEEREERKGEGGKEKGRRGKDSAREERLSLIHI